MKDGPHSNVEEEGWGSFAENGQLPVGTLGSVWVLGWDLGEGMVISEENSQPQDLRVDIETVPARLSAPRGACLVWFSLDTRPFPVTHR